MAGLVGVKIGMALGYVLIIGIKVGQRSYATGYNCRVMLCSIHGRS